MYNASTEAIEGRGKRAHLGKIVVRLNSDNSDGSDSCWPRRGVVQFENVWMKYSELAPFALKGVSFTLNHQDKVRRCGWVACVCNAQDSSCFAYDLHNASHCITHYLSSYLLTLCCHIARHQFVSCLLPKIVEQLCRIR